MCVGKRKFERKEEEEEEDASNKGGTCFAFFSPDAEAGCSAFFGESMACPTEIPFS